MLQITIVTLRSDISESAGATQTPEEAAEETTEALWADKMENNMSLSSILVVYSLLLDYWKLNSFHIHPASSWYFSSLSNLVSVILIFQKSEEEEYLFGFNTLNFFLKDSAFWNVENTPNMLLPAYPSSCTT
jgi:hypothetical protein